MTLEIHHLGSVDYLATFEAMKAHTADRLASRIPKTTQNTPQIGLQTNEYMREQLWICEHPAVYTQGLAGKVEHVLNPGNIPVVQTDRGGQVTFHGPGQVVAYPLMDLKAAGYYVKEYVYRVEEAVIRTLMHFGVTGHRVRGAPGIYVRLDDPFSHARLTQREPAKMGSEPLRFATGSDPIFAGLGKIAALGIKVSRHCTYHGVALNVAMDLEPFSRINPCGYAGLANTDLLSVGVSANLIDVGNVLADKLQTYLAA